MIKSYYMMKSLRSKQKRTKGGNINIVRDIKSAYDIIESTTEIQDKIFETIDNDVFDDTLLMNKTVTNSFPHDAKYVSDGLDIVSFVYRVFFSPIKIIIDFNNFKIDEKYRGKKILTNIFNRLEEKAQEYSKKYEKEIIIRITGFTNMLLAFSFVMKREYTPLRQIGMFQQQKILPRNDDVMKEYLTTLKTHKNNPLVLSMKLSKYDEFIPNGAQKIYGKKHSTIVNKTDIGYSTVTRLTNLLYKFVGF